MRMTGVFGLALTFFIACVSSGIALARTEAVEPTIALCPQAKLLVDKVATVILNRSPAEAFDAVVKDISAQICSLRKSSEGSPELNTAVDSLAVAVLGWPWSVSTLIKFNAERNSVAADIAAKEVKRKVTDIQAICPSLVIPDVASLS